MPCARFFFAAIAFPFCLWLLLAALAFAEPSTPIPGSHKCPEVSGRKETCVCQHAKGIIDVTPLSNNNGTAKFKGVTDANGYSYDYNPCRTFKSTNCDNKEVFNCQLDGGTGYIVGNGGTEEMWIDENGDPFLYYTGADNRLAIVHLHCDQTIRNFIMATTGDSLTKLHYIFDLTSCHVCPGGCVAAPAPAIHYFGGVAGVIGIVVIILLIASIATYFVAGALIMKFRYQASGTDIIPNKNLWIQFPLFVKDGCVFTFRPCLEFTKSKISGERSYQKM